MQFRYRHQRIQCIRSFYDPATKRSRQTTVLTFDRALLHQDFANVRAFAKEKLSDKELDDLEAWLDEERALSVERERIGKADMCYENMEILASAIKDGSMNLDEAKARNIQKGVALIQDALRVVQLRDSVEGG